MPKGPDRARVLEGKNARRPAERGVLALEVRNVAPVMIGEAGAENVAEEMNVLTEEIVVHERSVGVKTTAEDGVDKMKEAGAVGVCRRGAVKMSVETVMIAEDGVIAAADKNGAADKNEVAAKVLGTNVAETVNEDVDEKVVTGAAAAIETDRGRAERNVAGASTKDVRNTWLPMTPIAPNLTG